VSPSRIAAAGFRRAGRGRIILRGLIGEVRGEKNGDTEGDREFPGPDDLVGADFAAVGGDGAAAEFVARPAALAVGGREDGTLVNEPAGGAEAEEETNGPSRCWAETSTG